MEIKVELVHEKLGVCGTEIASSEKNKQKIISGWKSKYGKIMHKCTIISKIISFKNPGKALRAVIYKPTGDIYLSVGQAAHELGLSSSSITFHCKSENNPKFVNRFRWA